MKGTDIMHAKLRNRQIFASGLTQQDMGFRNALAELSGEVIDFYDYRTSAYNRLNHALIGRDINLEHPVTVIGLLDFEDNKLYVDNGEGLEYNLDDLDPRYLATINQTLKSQNNRLTQIPLTDIAMELLDDIHPTIEAKPEVDAHSLSGSDAVLQRAFANEMLFNVQMEEYIKDKHLDESFNLDSEELTELVERSSLAATFSEGLDDLDKHMSELVVNER